MKKIAILVETDFQDLEVYYPYYRFKEEGYEVLFLGTGSSQTYFGKYGIPVKVDADVQDVDADDFVCALIPGGWAPEHLRMSDGILDFVREMDRKDKVIASICHGGWVIASADIINEKKVTSYRAIKDDMINAGGIFEDSEVVIDGNLVTSRKPDDLPLFCRSILSLL